MSVGPNFAWATPTPKMDWICTLVGKTTERGELLAHARSTVLLSSSNRALSQARGLLGRGSLVWEGNARAKPLETTYYWAIVVGKASEGARDRAA